MDPPSAESHFSLFTITPTFSFLSFNAVVEFFVFFYHHRMKDEFCKEVLQDFLAADGELWKLMSSEKSATFDPKQTHPEISWFNNNPGFQWVKVLVTPINLTSSTPVSYWLKIKWLRWVLSPRIGKTSVGLQLENDDDHLSSNVLFCPQDKDFFFLKGLKKAENNHIWEAGIR